MAFTLYLVRHSKAHQFHSEGDRGRELSPEGFRRIDDILPRLLQRGFQAELYLSSPYVRARQTCDAFRSFFAKTGGSGKLELSSSFTPESEPEEALEELQALARSGVSSCAVFSHNPFITILAEVLATQRPVQGFQFHTPSVLAFSFAREPQKNEGKLLWAEHRSE